MNGTDMTPEPVDESRRGGLLRGLALSVVVRGVLVILLALVPLPPSMEASLPRATRLLYAAGLALPLFTAAALLWVSRRMVFAWVGFVVEVFTFGGLALLLRERALVALGLFLLPGGTLLRLLRVRKLLAPH